MKYLFLLSVVCVCAHVSAQSVKPLGIRLDSAFAFWKSNEPGGVACVVKNGAVVYKKAFGLADVKRGTPVSTDHAFDIGSDAKQFTAMSIALLEEQGLLSADDDIRRFYPGLKIKDTIRIRNLLDHTSGLRDASVLAILSGKMNLKGEVRSKYNTLDYYLACMMRETDLNYRVGEEFAYNNFNFVLLGDIVSRVSGKSLSQFCDSAIFKPLGMIHTVWRDRERMNIPNEVNGYAYDGKKFRRRKARGGIVGDHNLVSTVDDLVLWQLNFADNRLGKRDDGLIRRVTSASTLNNGESTNYGYGLWISTYRDAKVITHGGDDGRHTTVMKYFPDHGVHIIVLSNSGRFDLTDRLAYNAADIVLEKDFARPLPRDEEYTFTTLPPDTLKALTGLYTAIAPNGLAQVAHISFDKQNGELYGSRHPHAKGLKFSPVNQHHFIAVNREGEKVHLRFHREGGTIKMTENYRDYPARVLTRKKDEVVSFKDFPGLYVNSSTGARIKVKHKGDKISARKGLFRIPLMPFGRDQFYGPANDVLFIFSRDSSGNVTGFKANAYDFRNFYFEKR